MKRAVEAVLIHVDWGVLEKYVASNRPGNVYRKVMLGLMQKRVNQMSDEARAENYDSEETVAGIRKRNRGHDEGVMVDQDGMKYFWLGQGCQ